MKIHELVYRRVNVAEDGTRTVEMENVVVDKVLRMESKVGKPRGTWMVWGLYTPTKE